MSDDPFTRLRALNPVADPAGDDRTAAGGDAVLRRALAAERDGGTGQRPRRRRRALVAVAAGGALLTLAAAAWITTRPAEDPSEAACYREADLAAAAVVVAPGPAGPVEACAAVWRSGQFAAAPTGTSVPPLAPCVLGTGVVAVFPSGPGDPCARLGLDRADLSSGTGSRAVAAVAERLSAGFGAGCVDLATAAAVVDRELDAAGLRAWTVVPPAEIRADRPCASITVDAESQAIAVVPVPRPVDR